MQGLSTQRSYWHVSYLIKLQSFVCKQIKSVPESFILWTRGNPTGLSCTVQGTKYHLLEFLTVINAKR